MNVIRLFATLAMAVLLPFHAGCVNSQIATAKPIANSVAIEDVISQVQKALASVQTTLANKNFPILKQVKLSLQTVATKKDGVTLKLWVLSFGSTVEKTNTQQLDLVLVPPPAGLPEKTGLESLTEDLQNAILSAAEGVQKSKSGPVPLVVGSLDVQIGFTVKGDINGGANVEIAPVTLGLTGDVASAAVQTITVTFSNK